MIILILWLNWTNLIVQKSEKVEMWISRFVGWKSKLCSLAIIYNATLIVLKIKYFIILSYWRTTYLCKQPVRFLSIDSPRFDNRFLIHTVITFIVTLYIRRRVLHWCYWYSDLFALFILSWVMIILILWLNWTNLIVQQSEKVELWISQSVWWKSILCSLGIISNVALFVVQIKYFIILWYWRPTYLCKQPVRFLSIDSPRFDNRFFIRIAIIFTSTL
jgi:hypothetical protein